MTTGNKVIHNRIHMSNNYLTAVQINESGGGITIKLINLLTNEHQLMTIPSIELEDFRRTINQSINQL